MNKLLLVLALLMIANFTEVEGRRSSSVLKGPVEVDGDLKVTGQLDANVSGPKFKTITAERRARGGIDTENCGDGYTLEFWSIDAHNSGFREGASHNYCNCDGDKRLGRVTATLSVDGRQNPNVVCRCKGLCMES